MTKMPNLDAGPTSPSRRNFLAAVGATVASINTAACIRKPYERILPFASRPEDLVPGKPQYYATAVSFGESVQGLLACSTDGRPTKIEGNPNHPGSLGATNAWAQATVLGLYDPERTRNPIKDGEVVDVDAAEAELTAIAEAAAGGAAVGLVLDRTPSPTAERLVRAILERSPNTRVFYSDPAADEQALAGAAMVGIEGVSWTYGDEPDLVATFDADPMTTDGDVVPFIRAYAKGRAPGRGQKAYRLYSAEPNLTLTGSNADHRRAAKTGEVAELLAAVAHHLRASGMDLPKLPVSDAMKQDAWAKGLAADLADRSKGSTLIVVGERQPPQVHALGFLVNQALGNFGRTLRFYARDRIAGGTVADLVAAVDSGAVKHVVVVGANPVFDAAGDVDVAAALAKTERSVHVGLHRDETGRAAKVHVPMSHYLEAWGDLVGRDGTVAIQQPLIAPLYASMSGIEVLARLGGSSQSGYELVQSTHAASPSDEKWQTWLHDGVVRQGAEKTVGAQPRALATAWAGGVVEPGFEVVVTRDPSVLDGRFANSPWLQELPDPITKLTWDNAALLSPATADKLGVDSGRMIQVSHHGASLRLPVWIQPGTADDVVVLALGYGRAGGGRYAKSGFDVSGLRTAAAPWVLTGAEVKPARGTYALACTQVETDLRDRPMHREATRADFADDPDFVGKFEVMPPDQIKTFLWDEPFTEQQYRWGMTIDLNSCSGCGACTVACQAENNIPWVGKDEVLKGREMHWIRVDRYFEPKGQGGEVDVKHQPLNCQQCETAPCENVCPVAATVHSPEGMNDMVYNRCIGTRYCANNCPYKVRRFNFFHYAVRNDGEYGMGIAMQRNPNVTVRYRGVMEKCSYCVQRVTKARVDSKLRGDRTIREGEVVTACQQVCPSDAIAFGNLNDENSRVAKTSKDPRNYAVLAELNTRPRTTYLARLTNPNPKMMNG